MAQPLVVLPTFNERQSLPPLLEQIAAVAAHAHVLVVDDHSPDGTGVWAQEQSMRRSQLHVLHRPGKLGLGSAYKVGFAWGLERGFDPLLEMDADGSHHAEYVPALLAEVAAGADLAMGSRLVPGGGVRDWPVPRRLLSQGSNLVARAMLGLPVHDITSGFRAYRAAMLELIEFRTIMADGYAFQVEALHRVWRAGGEVVEVPIVFTDRTCGQSKINRMEVLQAMTTLARLRANGWSPRGAVSTGALRVPRRRVAVAHIGAE